MPTEPAPSKRAPRKGATAKSAKSKGATLKDERLTDDALPDGATTPTGSRKPSSAIWVAPETHRQAKIAVGFMIGTGEEKYRNLTLGVFTELAILDAMERFYAGRGMSMAKIKIRKAHLEERLRNP